MDHSGYGWVMHNRIQNSIVGTPLLKRRYAIYPSGANIWKGKVPLYNFMFAQANYMYAHVYMYIRYTCRRSSIHLSKL